MLIGFYRNPHRMIHCPDLLQLIGEYQTLRGFFRGLPVFPNNNEGKVTIV
jgi:hypothetical protein